MMLTGDKLRKEISHQEKGGWPAHDIKILLWFLPCCKTSSQWSAFTTVKWRLRGYRQERRPAERISK